MTQYIDKSAIIEEIEKLYKENYKFLPSDITENVQNFKDDLLMNLNTLEVKEVDFNTEVSKFIDTFYKNAKIGHKLMIRRTARYFFELGLKTQKGE